MTTRTMMQSEGTMAQANDTTGNAGSSAALWVVLARAYRAMESFVEHSVASLGIGLSDFMILEALLHKGPMTMTALCDAALLANASMTSAIDRLEEKKFVERTADKTDRRVRLVQLTPDGTALIKRLYPRHLKDLDEVMKDVPPAERAELRRGLKTIGLAAQAASRNR
ncbi:MarR family winged helix-turn-helix transcriptional regulator [Granulicella paludicola]|uniref:MarR family winged helix-turn-helix transcriptional regulator n=1 Tax=Granulicella paludicola TaxID=474951 RepID=UPI0021E0218A|nr:MarR family transcriptional regulator [Granulicella paludicola]